MPTSLGSCIVSNQVENLPDALIQARVAGKSWQQIADEFNFGSPSGARSAFKKLTGITDFKVKGKALQNFIDADLLDELKKPVIKVTKAQKAALKADEAFQAALKSDGVVVDKFLSAQPDLDNLTGEHIDIFKQAFPNVGPNYGLSIDSVEELNTYANAIAGNKFGKANVRYQEIKGIHGEVVDTVSKMLTNGSFYSDIHKATGLSFAEIDDIAWANNLIKSVSGTSGGNTGHLVWEAYKKKVTSETGFKAVQDTVWNMRKMGIDPSQIAKATGVDDNVVKLILSDSWTLPSKGATQYIGYKPIPSTSSVTGTTLGKQTVSELVGEGSEFKDMTQEQADYWAGHLGKDLTPEQVSAVQYYTGSGYRPVNDYLRKGQYTGDPIRLQRQVEDLSASMRPVLEDVTVHRQVGLDTFGGKLPQPGDAFGDKGFLSTSYGTKPGYGHGQIHMIIDLPKGSRARPVHQLSSAGTGEREILLDRDQKFIVTGLKPDPRGGTIVYLRLIP